MSNVEPPTQNPKRGLIRATLETALEVIPFIGPLSSKYLRITHPPKETRDQQKFNSAVSETLSTHADILSSGLSDGADQEITLEENTVKVGIAIVKKSRLGRLEHIDGIELSDELTSELTQENVIEAIGELEMYGFVEVTNFLGRPLGLGQIQIQPELYEILDPRVTGNSPLEDAAHIAKFATSKEQVSAEEIQEHFGWPARRINPAQLIICNFIGEGRQSRTMGSEWHCAHFFMLPSERAELRAFARRILS